jgi:hypothetical protein
LDNCKNTTEKIKSQKITALGVSLETRQLPKRMERIGKVHVKSANLCFQARNSSAASSEQSIHKAFTSDKAGNDVTQSFFWYIYII